MALTLEQARHDVGLPSRFTASITVGARIALWEGLLPRWVGRLREQEPQISIRSEIGFEEDLMRSLVEGVLDLALMYTPRHGPSVQVEHLFDETLVLVSTDPKLTQPDDRYVYVDWGPGFYAQHSAQYPVLERPPQIANIGWLGLQLILENGGSCFIPERMAQRYLGGGGLYLASDAPSFRLPAYVVYPSRSESSILDTAVALLRELAAAP
jgi:DNA-binding transcriptional LysR family regulator